MEAKTKRILIGSGALLVIGGTVAYLIWKNNKDKKDKENAKADDAKAAAQEFVQSQQSRVGKNGGSGAKPKTTNVIASSPTSFTAPPRTVAPVSAHSFLASGGNINQKKLYGAINDSPIYDGALANNIKIGVVRRGEYLGVAYKAELLPNGKYFIYFMNPNNKASKVLASSVTI